MTKYHRTIVRCLNDLDISSDTLRQSSSSSASLQEEFKIIKKIYFVRILEQHPDKGGDAETFRKTRAAWEILRDLKVNGKVQTFVVVGNDDENDDDNDKGKEDNSSSNEDEEDDYYYDTAFDDFFASYEGKATPSYEYYQDMAAAAADADGSSDIPGYKVELARSGRSQCAVCKKKKEQGNNKGKREKRESSDNGNTADMETTTTLVAANTTATTTATRPRRYNQRPQRKAAMAKSSSDNATNTRTAIVNNNNNNTSSTASSSITATTAIPKASIRVGSFDKMSGSYCRWHHLACWKVPYRIWAALTDPTNAQQVQADLHQMEEILLTGVSNLSLLDERDDDNNSNNNMIALVEHIMDQSHWATKTKRSKPPPDLEELGRQAAAAAKMDTSVIATAATLDTNNKKRGTVKMANLKPVDSETKKAKTMTGSSISSSATTISTNKKENNAIVTVAQPSQQRAKATFDIPRPGVNGAKAGCYNGLRFVLTGVFPEVGGGAGLNMGKDKVKEMIASFGGRVTGSVSGKTNFLVVGKEPGASKVSAAQSKGLTLVDLKSMREHIMGEIPALEEAEAPAIRSFSAGYSRNLIGYY